MKSLIEQMRRRFAGRRAGVWTTGAVVLAVGAIVIVGQGMRAETAPRAAAIRPALDPAEFVADGNALLRVAYEPLSAPEYELLEVGPPLGAPGVEWPSTPRVAKPDAVRGIYVSSWSAGSSRRLSRLLQLAYETEINSFVIDVKDVTGHVSYWSTTPVAREVGANGNLRIGDIRHVLRQVRAYGVYPIARIVVFKDPLLAEAKPEWAIRTKDGGIWRDQQGYAWVDPYNREVWDYVISLAREAAALGFSEIQWDYVRFPDVPWEMMKTAVFPAREGRTRAQAIREFMRYSREQLADFDVPVTADVFGITVSAEGDVGIGQKWTMMQDVVDVLLPMVYPSHYPNGSYGIAHPNASPYTTILRAMEHAVRRSRDVPGAASVRPWLQDFTLGDPAYGPEHVRAQIQAVYDAGLTEWVLWNPSSRYTVEALGSRDGRTPSFPLPDPEFAPDTAAPAPDSSPRLIGVPTGT